MDLGHCMSVILSVGIVSYRKKNHPMLEICTDLFTARYSWDNTFIYAIYSPDDPSARKWMTYPNKVISIFILFIEKWNLACLITDTCTVVNVVSFVVWRCLTYLRRRTIFFLWNSAAWLTFNVRASYSCLCRLMQLERCECSSVSQITMSKARNC